MDLNRCHFGDCRDVLRRMIADGVKVNMCATSPPYWNLRDYGTATWEGGDDPGCDHNKAHSMDTSGLEGGKTTTLHAHYYRDRCGKCGARRIDSQLGLEPTLDCGKRGLFRLRGDLTEAQREYVARRLLGVAGPCVQDGGTVSTK